MSTLSLEILSLATQISFISLLPVSVEKVERNIIKQYNVVPYSGGLSTQRELSMAVLDLNQDEIMEGKVSVEIQHKLDEHFPEKEKV